MKKMHENSLEAFGQLKPLGPKHRKILQIFHITGRPMTDREIKVFGKYDDMNECRPRLSELINLGRLIECGKIKDVKTKKMVRQTRLKQPGEDKQRELF